MSSVRDMLASVTLLLLMAGAGNSCTTGHDPSGYSPTLGLLNHRWDGGCPLWDDDRIEPPPGLPSAVGPCPAEYQIVNLPPAFFPDFLMVATCLSHCSHCSSRGPFRCREVKKKVKIWMVDSEKHPPVFLDAGHRTITTGCVCMSNTNGTFTYNTPPRLVT